MLKNIQKGENGRVDVCLREASFINQPRRVEQGLECMKWLNLREPNSLGRLCNIMVVQQIELG